MAAAAGSELSSRPRAAAPAAGPPRPRAGRAAPPRPRARGSAGPGAPAPASRDRWARRSRGRGPEGARPLAFN